LKGPGVVTRIWTPTPSDDPLELYFDGETEPRLRLLFRDLFSGAREPFLRPLVGSAHGGNVSYIPIPYERSLTILFRVGHVVAAILQAQGPEPGHTSFFEGDDIAILDGKLAITERAPRTSSTAAGTTSLAAGNAESRFP
jgi:hypothetical protein